MLPVLLQPLPEFPMLASTLSRMAGVAVAVGAVVNDRLAVGAIRVAAIHTNHSTKWHPCDVAGDRQQLQSERKKTVHG